MQESVIAFQTRAREVLRGVAPAQHSDTDNLKTLAVTLATIQSAKTGEAMVPEGAA